MKYTTKQLIDRVNKSYESANSKESKLTQEITKDYWGDFGIFVLEK